LCVVCCVLCVVCCVLCVCVCVQVTQLSIDRNCYVQEVKVNDYNF